MPAGPSALSVAHWPNASASSLQMSNTWSRWVIRTDDLERRLRDLPEPDLRQVALMKLEGHANCEVAETLASSERIAERKLNLICKRGEAGGERRRRTALGGHAVSNRSQGTQTWIDKIATPFDRAWRANVLEGGIGQRPRIEDCLAGDWPKSTPSSSGSWCRSRWTGGARRERRRRRASISRGSPGTPGRSNGSSRRPSLGPGDPSWTVRSPARPTRSCSADRRRRSGWAGRSSSAPGSARRVTMRVGAPTMPSSVSPSSCHWSR